MSAPVHRLALVAALVAACTFDSRGRTDEPPDEPPDGAPDPTPDAEAVPPGAEERIFQEGLAGYAGTVDTYLSYEYVEPIGRGMEGTLRWDAVSGATVALLRFDGALDDGSSGVPMGAEVMTAALSLQVENPGDQMSGTIHDVLQDWNEATTSLTFGAVSGTDYETQSVTAAPRFGGATSVDVTSSVQSWANGAVNLGWIFVPAENNSVEITSSEGAAAGRPRLRVIYLPP